MLCPAKPTHAMLQVFLSGNHFYLLVVGVVSPKLNTRINNFRETFVRDERTFVTLREERTFVRDEGMSRERRPLGPP